MKNNTITASITTKLFLLLTFLAPAALFGQYRSDGFTSTPASGWTINGGTYATFNNPGGYRNMNSTPSSLISTVAIPTLAPNVSVNSFVQLTPGADSGTYVQYVRASSDALYGPSPTGTFYALVVTATATSNACSATFTLWKKGAAGLTNLWNSTVSCLSDNYTVVPMLVSRDGNLYVYNWARHLGGASDSEILTGMPGVGGHNMGASSGFTYTDLAVIDYIAPLAVSPSNIAVSTSPGRVDFRFPGTTDPGGSGRGVAYYQLWRAPQGTTNWGPTPIGELVIAFGQFADKSVSPGTAYTYRIDSYDYEGNFSSVQFNATTPPAGTVEPRRNGLPPTAVTWGALGSNIDLVSGNVNFNLPLLKAQARGGWGVTFALNHDTQSWKKEGSTIWKYGVDKGYGYGWKLFAGSVVRYYKSTGVTSHVVFTDSTGAEYRLDRPVNPDGSDSATITNPDGSTSPTITGLWAASSDNFYGIFNEDWGVFRMKFPDGSFWDFGSRSRDTGDFSTDYPTLFQDSNGNQIKVVYQWGTGRITQIEDVRAVLSGGNWATYDFNYDNSTTPPHLTSITNRIGTHEGYSFTYATQTLAEPFSATAWPTGSNMKFLTGLTISGVNLNYSMEYQTPWTGELSKVTLPQGGYVRWTLMNWNYTASRTLREVSAWIQSKDGTVGSEKSYVIGHEANDGTRTIHFYSDVLDASNTGKRFCFNSNGTLQWAWTFVGSTGVLKQSVDTTWSTDAHGKPYISVTTTKYDPGQTYESSKRVEQTIDSFGNMTQTKLFDWGNTTTARRVYNNTYLATTNYVNAYIRNRLLKTTYSENGGSAVTLVSNEYDNYSAGCTSQIGSCVITATSGARQKDAAYTTSNTLRGNVTSSYRYGSGSIEVAYPQTWAWRLYDDTGNVVKTKSPQGVVGTAVEDTSKNYAVPASMTVAGLTSSMSWNGFLGLTSATGANGESSGTVYDSYSRPASKTSPTGAVTTYAYTQNTVTATTNGRYVKTTVDGFGRTTFTETGYGTTAVSIVENQYEPCGCTPIGKLSRTSRPYAPGATTKYWTTYTYDQLGRTVSVVAPDAASTTSYLYQGNTVKTTDAAGKWKKFTQDAVGNLVQVNEPNPAGGSDYVTTYTFDAYDHLTGVSMPRPTGTQTRTFTYFNGMLAGKTEPETGSIGFSFNTDMTLNYKVDAKGQKTSMVYDGNKRVIQVQKFPDGVNEDLCQRVDYYYDSNPFDGTYSSYVNGRLAAVQYWGRGCDPVNGGNRFIEMYSYTPYGAMTKKKLQLTRMLRTNVGQIATYAARSAELDTVAGYDAEGRLETVQYPLTGQLYKYSYDSRGMLGGLRDQTNGVDMVAAIYGLAGELLNFNAESRSYNVNGQLTGITMPGGRTVTYNFPAAGANNGKVASIVDSGETITYQYDSLQRLISATGSGWSQTYTYDGFGNLYGKAGTGTAPSWGAAIDAATNRMTGISYDANGNQLFAPMTAGMPNAFNLSYDVSNRMTTAATNIISTKTEYEYDPGNKRITEVSYTVNAQQDWVKNGETLHFFGITGQRLGTYGVYTTNEGSSSAALVIGSANSNWVWFGSKLVKSGSTFVNEDQLGSIGKYLPYGEDKPGATGNPGNGDVKFATYVRDANTGIDYADQRWHAQGTGRFLTSDPYQASGGPGDPGSWNRYGYVGGDPISGIDPEGLQTFNVVDCYRSTARWPDGSMTQSGVTCYIASQLYISDPVGGRRLPFSGGFRDEGSSLVTKYLGFPIANHSNLQGQFKYSLSVVLAEGTGCREFLDQYFRKNKMGDVDAFARNYVRFVDASNEGVPLDTSISDIITGYAFPDTAGDILCQAGPEACANAAQVRSTNTVLLGNGFFAADSVQRMFAFIHEALHVYAKKGDRGLVTAFGLNSAGSATDSMVLQGFLESDCRDKNPLGLK